MPKSLSILLPLIALTHHTLIMVSFLIAVPSFVILRKLTYTIFTMKEIIAQIFWLKKEHLIQNPLFLIPILLLVFCTSS